jgi:hypothetical protein
MKRPVSSMLMVLTLEAPGRQRQILAPDYSGHIEASPRSEHAYGPGQSEYAVHEDGRRQRIPAVGTFFTFSSTCSAS